MKLIGRCLVLVLPILSGCKGQLAGVTLNLTASGSGDCEIAGIRDVQYAADESANPDAVMQNATEIKALDLRVRLTKAKFASINDFKIGDVTFLLEKQEGKNLLTVRIPAGANSRWFNAFGVSARSLELWSKVEDASKRGVSGVEFEPPKPPTVLFEVNLPAKLEGQGFETVPLGLDAKIAVDHSERVATLTIPLADIHASKVKEVVWKISYAAQ